MPTGTTIESPAKKQKTEKGALPKLPCSSHPLPPEMWVFIFSYLSPEQLAQMSFICRGWRSFSNEPSLWKPHFTVAGFATPQSPPASYRALFWQNTYQLPIAVQAVLQLLLETQLNEGEGEESVLITPKGQKINLMKVSLNEFCHTAFKACYPNLSPWNLLQAFCRKFQPDSVEKWAEILNQTGPSGVTLLHCFMSLVGETESEDCIRFLIEKGADVNCKTEALQISPIEILFSQPGRFPSLNLLALLKQHFDFTSLNGFLDYWYESHFQAALFQHSAFYDIYQFLKYYKMLDSEEFSNFERQHQGSWDPSEMAAAGEWVMKTFGEVETQTLSPMSQPQVVTRQRAFS